MPKMMITSCVNCGSEIGIFEGDKPCPTLCSYCEDKLNKTEYATKQFTRDDLVKVIHAECDRIKELFSYKNTSYGQQQSPFYNFEQTAKNELDDASYNGMYKALRIFVSKHDAALKNNGLDDQEAIERLRDIAVYQLIAIGMAKAAGK